MRRVSYAASVALIAGLALNGCGPVIVGNGDVITEDREVTGFSGVRIDGSADVYVMQDTSESVVVETDENLMEYVTTELVGGMLAVDTRQGVALAPTKLIVYVQGPDIDELSINGSGDITASSTLIGERLDLSIDGSGDISARVDMTSVYTSIDGSGDVTLSGETDAHSISIDGSGDVKASNLATSTTTITIDGSGNCKVNAAETLTVTIDGSGDVYYRGSPTVNQSISGSGDVIRQ